jgi:hypothetical protein
MRQAIIFWRGSRIGSATPNNALELGSSRSNKLRIGNPKMSDDITEMLLDAIAASGEKRDEDKPRTIVAAICAASSDKGPRLSLFAESLRAVGGPCIID